MAIALDVSGQITLLRLMAAMDVIIEDHTKQKSVKLVVESHLKDGTNFFYHLYPSNTNNMIIC